jgi:hypothetical protein
MRIWVIAWVFIFNLHAAFSQTITLFVHLKDENTQKPVPFCPARILPPNFSSISNLEGTLFFTLLPGTYTLHIKNDFYEEHTEIINLNSDAKTSNLIISLKNKISDLSEITVTAGENPALDIIRKCIKKMPDYNPMNKDGFTAKKQARMKIILSDRNGNEEFYKSSDSAVESKYNKYKKFIKDKYLYYFENESELRYTKKAGLKEKITYARAPGFSRSPFSTFFAILQSFGFYDESVNILDVTYLSPLSEQGMKHYKYRITDTLTEQADTFYVIRCEPKGKSLYALLKGHVYIHSSEHYLKGVDIKPYQTDEKFLYATRQFYTKNQSGTVYPYQTDTYILIPNKSLDDKGPGGTPLFTKLRGEIKLFDFKTDTVPAIRSGEPPFEEADKMNLRPSLNDSDPDSLLLKNTEHYSDSLFKKINAEKKFRFFSFFVSGLIPIGKIGMDWTGILRYNLLEGYAPGTTFSNLPKTGNQFLWQLGGRYGLDDKAWKARLSLGYQWITNKKHILTFQAGWIKDIMENGSLNVYMESSLRDDEAIRKFYISSADYFEAYFMKWNIQRIKNFRFTATLYYLDARSKTAFLNNADASAQFNYAGPVSEFQLRFKAGEYLLKSAMGYLPYNENKNTPEIILIYKKSWMLNNIRNHFNVNRLDLIFTQAYFPFDLTGLVYTLRGGYSFVPSNYRWLYHHHASRYENFSVSYPRGMETMFLNEFMSSDYLQANVAFCFKKIFPSNKYFNPQLELVHNACIGRVSERVQYSEVVMSVPEKPFTEAGIRLLKLYGNNFSQFGAGIFYRYGNYAHENNKYNWVYKLALNYAF